MENYMYNCPVRCFCEQELGTLPRSVSLGMSFQQEENPNPKLSPFCFPAPRASGEGFKRGHKERKRKAKGGTWARKKGKQIEDLTKGKHWGKNTDVANTEKSSFNNLISLDSDSLLKNGAKSAMSPLSSWRIWFTAGPWKFQLIPMFCIFSLLSYLVSEPCGAETLPWHLLFMMFSVINAQCHWGWVWVWHRWQSYRHDPCRSTLVHRSG